MLMILTVQTQMRKEDKTAETKTKRATFKLAQVPYGYYYMYAVAIWVTWLNRKKIIYKQSIN